MSGPRDSVSFLIARTGFRSARRLRERLAPFDVDLRQFFLLNQVAIGEGLSQQAIGDAAGIPKSRMVALVDDLERRGLVERRAGDRRTHALHLTPAGHELLAATRQAARDHDAELSSRLTSDERRQLVTLLGKLADGP